MIRYNKIELALILILSKTIHETNDNTKFRYCLVSQMFVSFDIHSLD